PIRRPGEPLGDAFLRAVRDLDGSLLCVQGPPGAGKTSESARVICALLRAGKRVGIASNSHKAIANLMEACARENGGTLACVQVGRVSDGGGVPSCSGARVVAGASDLVRRAPDAALVGGPAGCFSRPDLAGRFDYLFVDEASQVSLA